jgi:hypothetical protein
MIDGGGCLVDGGGGRRERSGERMRVSVSQMFDSHSLDRLTLCAHIPGRTNERVDVKVLKRCAEV